MPQGRGDTSTGAVFTVIAPPLDLYTPFGRLEGDLGWVLLLFCPDLGHNDKIKVAISARREAG